MRKSFIKVIPVGFIRLSTQYRKPKYVRENLNFEVGDLNDYFIAKDIQSPHASGELWVWLSAEVHTFEDIVHIQSKPIPIAQYYENRSEFNQLFYTLVKRARAQLKTVDYRAEMTELEWAKTKEGEMVNCACCNTPVQAFMCNYAETKGFYCFECI